MPVILPGKIKRLPQDKVKEWRKNSLVRKAKKSYKKKMGGKCEWSGSKWFVQVHHKVSMSVAPQLGMLHSNMVCLHRGAHLWLGHFGNFKTSFLANIDEVLAIAQRQMTEGDD